MPYFENGGGTKWNLLDSKTGNTAINLPSSFNELLVITKLTSYNLHFSFNIPKLFLESNGKGFRSGYYGTGTNGFCEIVASLSSVNLANAQSSGSTVTQDSTTTVYYR